MSALSITKAIGEAWWVTGRGWLFRRLLSDLIGNWSGAFFCVRQAEISLPQKHATISAAIPFSTISRRAIFKPDGGASGARERKRFRRRQRDWSSVGHTG